MNQIVNTAIQVIPIGEDNCYEHVDQAIEIIKQSGHPFEVGPFSTSIESSLEEVLNLIPIIEKKLFESGLNEILINVQIHSRKNSSVSTFEKVEKFR
jgi:uncharacterized protein YqgV (UPF0045/DUF77 family)